MTDKHLEQDDLDRLIIRELSRLPSFAPSRDFGDRVMAQVRLPEPKAVVVFRRARAWALQPRRALGAGGRLCGVRRASRSASRSRGCWQHAPSLSYGASLAFAKLSGAASDLGMSAGRLGALLAALRDAALPAGPAGAPGPARGAADRRVRRRRRGAPPPAQDPRGEACSGHARAVACSWRSRSPPACRRRPRRRSNATRAKRDAKVALQRRAPLRRTRAGPGPRHGRRLPRRLAEPPRGRGRARTGRRHDPRRVAAVRPGPGGRARRPGSSSPAGRSTAPGASSWRARRPRTRGSCWSRCTPSGCRGSPPTTRRPSAASTAAFRNLTTRRRRPAGAGAAAAARGGHGLAAPAPRRLARAGAHDGRHRHPRQSHAPAEGRCRTSAPTSPARCGAARCASGTPRCAPASAWRAASSSSAATPTSTAP